KELVKHVSERADPGDRRHLDHAEVGLPRRILEGGLEIVDTPGVGGLNSVHGAATMAALPSADAVLLVSDASQEYTAPELEFLRQAIRVCPNVACVLTKTDLYPEWRRIAELDRAHLAAAGVDAELLAVSAAVRWQAMKTDDADLDAVSGFPDLARFLRRRVVGQADVLARRSTVHDVVGVTEQLAGGLRTEQGAQENPESIRELVAELSAAQREAAALKERSARWQHTLNDGVADLNADIDHDLRDRMREIIRLAEDEIDGGEDPAKVWDQISQWVEQQAAAAASANYIWATQRARWLSAQVAQHFSEDTPEVLPELRTEASDALSAVRGMKLRENEEWNLQQKALTGLRGGYIGVLMFGLLGTFVGLSLVNPFSLGAGLLLGGKTISDERRRIVTRRQNEARQAVRRYIDDVTFQVGKDSRDMLRQVQRDLRDHFTAEAEQTSRSLQQSLRATEGSLKSSKADRQKRLTQIKDDLQRLERLQQRVRTLLPDGESLAGGRLPKRPDLEKAAAVRAR
ncbi:MAG: dynamin family protein, partial [Pseudonocardia sp.]|nr:dynamin family protein [Pseudonocardia sp.]